MTKWFDAEGDVELRIRNEFVRLYNEEVEEPYRRMIFEVLEAYDTLKAKMPFPNPPKILEEKLNET